MATTLKGLEKISIHALREERDKPALAVAARTPQISIHALREERDLRTIYSRQAQAISIHALREERDDTVMLTGGVDVQFQSTRSARSATQ